MEQPGIIMFLQKQKKTKQFFLILLILFSLYCISVDNGKIIEDRKVSQKKNFKLSDLEYTLPWRQNDRTKFILNELAEIKRNQILPYQTTPDQFITVWQTNISISSVLNSSLTNQIQLPLIETGIYDFSVNWGDGSSDTITTHDQIEALHTYNNSQSQYTIVITGTIEGWNFDLTTGYKDQEKLLDILQWGSFVLGNGRNSFLMLLI